MLGNSSSSMGKRRGSKMLRGNTGGGRGVQRGQGQDAKKESIFPVYYSTTSVPATTADAAPPEFGGDAETTAADGAVLLKMIQQQLNKSRKVDSRLRKLASGLQQKKHSQWNALQKEILAAYHAERKSYSADVSSLEKEIADAKNSKDMAIKQLLAAGTHGCQDFRRGQTRARRPPLRRAGKLGRP